MTGLSESIGKCCTPWASADEKSRGARPPRLELGTLPEKASADLDGVGFFIGI